MTTVPLSSVWRSERARRRRSNARPALVLLVAYLARHLPAPRVVRGALLRLGGLSALVAAAWSWSLIAGLAALGVSLLLLEWSGDRR